MTERRHSEHTPKWREVQSGDGTRIACWTLGQGRPLVYVAGGPWSHIELIDLPACRRWYELLARDRMLVRFDMRGTGRSDRGVADYSLEAQLMDLQAIVGALGLDRFDLLGAADAGALAIAFASHHPAHVSHLALWCAWTRAVDVGASPRIQAWRRLIDEDWDLMTETCAHLALGWSGGEVGRLSAQRLRESVTADDARAALNQSGLVDVSDLVPKVQAPALVMHRTDIAWLPVEIAHELAARLPDARLSLFPGESTAPYISDAPEIAAELSSFLDDRASVRGSGRGTGDTPPPPLETRHPLSPREAQILGLLVTGRTNQEIASALVLSPRTIERHVQNAYRKIGAHRRAEATAYALRNGLV